MTDLVSVVTGCCTAQASEPLMPCGLCKKSGGSPIPLRSVRVESTVIGYTARVLSRLEYENEEGNPVEAVFTFPLDESSTVVDFTALIDDRKIVGIIKEKEEAKQAYDDAIASGQSAFLMESVRHDIFTVSVGNLPPKKKATVEITFIMELPTEHDGSVRFNLPSVLTPRYHAASSNPAESTNPTTGVTYLPASAIPYTFSFEMRIEADVDSVTSPTHQLTTAHAVDDDGYSVTLVRLAEEHRFDKDVVVTIKPKNTHQPHAVVEMGAEGGVALLSDPAVTLNYFPDFSTTDAVSELIFVIDRSGSMRGKYIEAAKETMMLFLKSIPDDCYFNIVGFGSSHEKLFKESVAYNQGNLDKAMQHTKSLQANLGGTVLLAPLQEIFKMPSVKGLPKQIFVLTDGAVSNTYSVIEEVKKNAHKARCFSVGIGSGASTELVKGIAEAGKGSSEFIQSGERMQPKVMRMLKRALAPSVSDVHISWSLPEKSKVIQTPSKVPPVFSGDRLIIYGFLVDLPQVGDLKGSASLKGYMGTENLELSIDFEVKPSGSSGGKAVHQLAIKSLIRDVESDLTNKDIVKKQLGSAVKSDKDAVVKLSTSASVICSQTSFVAVDKENEEPVTGSMELRQIPMAMAELSATSSMSMGPLRRFKNIGAPTRMLCCSLPMGSAREGVRVRKLSRPTTHSSSRSTPRSSSRSFSNFDAEADAAARGEVRFRKACASSPSSRSFSNIDADANAADERVFEGASRQKMPDADDTFLKIVSLQEASGAWPLDSVVAHLLRKSAKDLDALSPLGKDSSTVCKSMWATAVVLAWLQAKCAGSKDEWELMANKAIKWAKKQTFPEGITWENLMDAAKKLV